MNEVLRHHTATKRKLPQARAELYATAVNHLYKWTHDGYFDIARDPLVRAWFQSYRHSLTTATPEKPPWPAISRGLIHLLAVPKGDALWHLIDDKESRTDGPNIRSKTLDKALVQLRDWCINMLALTKGNRAADIQAASLQRTHKGQSALRNTLASTTASSGPLTPLTLHCTNWKQRRIAASKGTPLPSTFAFELQQLPVQLCLWDAGIWLQLYDKARTILQPTCDAFFHGSKKAQGLTADRIRNIRKRFLKTWAGTLKHQHAFRGIALSHLLADGATKEELLAYVGSTAYATMQKHYLRDVETIFPTGQRNGTVADDIGMRRLFKALPPQWTLGALGQQFLRNYTGDEHPVDWIRAQNRDGIWTRPTVLAKLTRSPAQWYALIKTRISADQWKKHEFLQATTLDIFTIFTGTWLNDFVSKATESWAPSSHDAAGEAGHSS